MAHHLIFILSSLVLTTLVALQETHAVQYEVTNDAAGTPGGTRFENEIGVEYSRRTLESASAFIWQIFGQFTEADRRNVPIVKMFVRTLDGVAYASNGEIHVSANYIAGYSGDVIREITGALYHEATHVWQWNGNGNAPGGGNRWDEGYDVTAQFLDYCNSLRDGFVAELNNKMSTGYSNNFFVELLGKTVDQLWSEYKANYGN
ncbi:Uncharacterized protein family [Macleaya cordata]|uniref:Uncharacterized protein family n=1 Tax=Macleaya cordata TaxID=56857 RepID=A0A200PUZ7_MACCD|nr:Uncharacterized protein family [Macleaya cordata]